MLLLLRGSLGWQGWCWEEVVVPAFVLGHPQGVVLDPWAGVGGPPSFFREESPVLGIGSGPLRASWLRKKGNRGPGLACSVSASLCLCVCGPRGK